MGITITNRGLYYLANNAISGSTDIRAGVIKGAVPSAATIRDLNFVADLLAEDGVVEAAAAGYSRQDLANVALTEVDASDHVTLTTDGWTMTVAAGETWLATFYFVHTGDNATATLLAVDEPASSQVTNGGDISQAGLDLTFAQGA